MATVKIKLRPSSVEGKAGVLSSIKSPTIVKRNT